MSETDSPFPVKGRLYVVATPIGNLGDLTFRALKTLADVDVIACEDTRHTLKLLNHYQIKKRLVSYFQAREKQKVGPILELLKQGKDVALVSDAGTPGISDPGFPLIQAALEHTIPVIPIPGVSALSTALSAAGLPTHRFLFLGFPPPKPQATKILLQSLKEEPATLIFYLPARRLEAFLKLVQENLGDRQVVVAREMTKIHEEFTRGSAEIIQEKLKGRAIRGEVTLLVEGLSRKARTELSKKAAGTFLK